MFASSGNRECIDAENGIYMEAKPITELDRLVYVINQIAQLYCVPKGSILVVPSGGKIENDGFKGLSKQNAF